MAAGRAVLPEVPAAGTNLPFQIYFVGDPGGTEISTSAPASDFLKTRGPTDKSELGPSTP